MGDAGSLPLGFLLASMSITGVMKTAAALALVFPLIVLLVPILDTSFVILKRLKYGQSVTVADRNHLHHRMLRVGYSQRQAALLLYGWCLVLAAFALAVRFLHYKHPNGTIDLGAARSPCRRSRWWRCRCRRSSSTSSRSSSTATCGCSASRATPRPRTTCRWSPCAAGGAKA